MPCTTSRVSPCAAAGSPPWAPPFPRSRAPPSLARQKCDGSLRIWLLVAICVTGVCGLLGALFHGRAEGTRPSRFLDDGDEEDEEMGQDTGYGPPQGMDLRPMDSVPVSKPPLPTLDEEGSSIDNGDRSVVSDAPDSCGTSVTS